MSFACRRMFVLAMGPALAMGASVRAETLDFEDLVVGTEYTHDDIFVTNGVDIVVATFFFSNGTPFDGGFSEVDNFGNAGGSGNELEINNVNLDFHFGAELTNLSLRFGEYGGNLNISINSDFLNFQKTSSSWAAPAMTRAA